MSCVRIPGGIVSVADIYHFEGFTFEWHYWCGPMKLRKDGEPSKASCGNRFYDATARWRALPKEEREKYRI